MYPFTNIDYVRHVPNYTRAHDVDTVDAMPDPSGGWMRSTARRPNGYVSSKHGGWTS